MAVLAILLGCQQESKSPDVTDSVRRSLDQVGLKDVRVSQDRDKGVVTLSGNTTSDTEKGQAEAIARSIALDEVVAGQIALRKPAHLFLWLHSPVYRSEMNAVLS